MQTAAAHGQQLNLMATGAHVCYSARCVPMPTGIMSLTGQMQEADSLHMGAHG